MTASGDELQIDVSNVTFFNLDDQQIPVSSLKGEVVVLSGGGQGAIEPVKEWGATLLRECESRQGVKFFTTAFVGQLPPFVPKIFVKANLSQGSQTPPLIDWDGNPTKAFGVSDPNLPYIFIIDKEGKLRFKLAEKYSEEGLYKIIQQIDKLK
jgi:hypothetical protein